MLRGAGESIIALIKTDNWKYIPEGHVDFLISHFVLDAINW